MKRCECYPWPQTILLFTLKINQNQFEKKIVGYI